MSIGWNFPSNNYGTLNGIGEAGIETFKGNPYRSLAREICQNSLDARRNEKDPVLIEFACTQRKPSELPDFIDLQEAISSCLSFWRKQENKKTVDFFENALTVAKQEQIAVLRISDFCTTGLIGSDQDYNTPWQNLVKASGVSDKGAGSGGSFGIGKSAPFACSDLRTVFYATKDMNGLEASQGIARLVSYPQKSHIWKKDTDKITTGIGYYGEKEKNRAIQDCRSLDASFQRTDIGTDVFIVGFTNKKDWEKEVIAAVLDDFLLSIFYGLLEVKVEQTFITKDTLSDRIEEYKDIVPMAYNYYQTLVSPNATVMNEVFEDLGDIELHILIQNDLHRRVFMGRSNGMKVFDQKNFPSAIQFAGVCILKSEAINSYFREMENPQHNAWEPERHSKPSEARKRKQGLLRLVKEKVLDLGRKTPVEEDAEGVGEFLPDDVPLSGGGDKLESITDTTKSIELLMSGLKGVQEEFEKATPSDLDSIGIRDSTFDADASGFGSKDFGDDKSNSSDNGTGYGNNPGNNPGTNAGDDDRYTIDDNSQADAPIKKKFEITMKQTRLIHINPHGTRYRLIFTPNETVDKGYLQLKLSGEQGDLDVSVSNADIVGVSQRMVTSKNRIYLDNIISDQKVFIEFDVNFTEHSSMEVRLYGYKT